MDKLQLIVTIALLAVTAYLVGTHFILKNSKKLVAGNSKFDKNLKSLPKYYGYCTALWSIIPAAFLVIIFSVLDKQIVNFHALGANPYILPLIAISIVFIVASVFVLKPGFNAREHFEKWLKRLFILCSAIAVSITILIFISVVFESIKFFEKISIFDFLFGLEWSPQTALRIDQAGSSGSFGIIPVFIGTFLITTIAMIVAVPLGLMSAIYLSEYAKPRTRNLLKPILEILAGVPTVVYGYFAAITMGPLLRDLFAVVDMQIATESAVAAGSVMGVMIIPFMMSLSDDVMAAVPRSLRDASLGLGATKSETIKKVVIPAALPGIMGAFLLSVSRAIGETMIVVMAAGLIATLTFNPFDSVTTVTAQIVRLLVGDQEFDSAKTLSAFALSLTLFLITLVLNFAALVIVKKYRERYE